MPAAARVGDHHTCPKSEPGPVPHVGGAILPSGCPSVLIHDMPAARVGDRSMCNGPPDTIVMGEASVLIANKPAARVGDPTSHGGVIVAGCGCVQIGQLAQAIVMRDAAKSGTPFCEECARKKAAADARKKKKKHNKARKKAKPAAPTQTSAPAPHAASSGRMGSLSRHYESARGGPGTAVHNPGDSGGASYGTWQIATNTGTMRRFLSSIATTHPEYSNQLAGLTPGSAAFDAAWKGLAASDPQGFESAQYDFIRATHYDVAQSRIAERVPGLDVDARSESLREVLWSTSVQHGGAGAATVFQRAIGHDDPSSLTDEQIIGRVYAERGADNGHRYFSRNSEKIQHQQVDRFRHEEADALQMLGRERSGR